MSASVATREFLLHLKAKKAKEMFFPALLPAMCLNRYSVKIRGILLTFCACARGVITVFCYVCVATLHTSPFTYNIQI